MNYELGVELLGRFPKISENYGFTSLQINRKDFSTRSDHVYQFWYAD